MSKNELKKEKIKGMLVYLNESLYRKFKSKLSLEGKSVKEIIHKFVSLYVEEKDEPERKKSKKNNKKNEEKK